MKSCAWPTRVSCAQAAANGWAVSPTNGLTATKSASGQSGGILASARESAAGSGSVEEAGGKSAREDMEG